jgi:hypothetical protein
MEAIMKSISVWQNKALKAGSWFMEDPQRLVAVLTLLTLVISVLGVLGYISGLDAHGVKLAPSPGGGSGGSGSPSGPG